MIVLGIESTAHTFGIGVIKEKKILVNKRDLFTTEEGGMVPAEVADHHVDVCDGLLKKALIEAKINMNDVDLIAFSQGPGIGHCLKVGAFFARALSLKYDKPIVGVNHCVAHLELGSMLFDCKDSVLLYVSGANTQVIAYAGGTYRIFGETLDMGVGNFIDAFARYLGLGFPGGPKIEKLASKTKEFVKLPYSVKGMDVSVGGMLTNMKRKYSSGVSKEVLCYSVQETLFAMLVEVAERALAHCGKKGLVLGGGVACNKRLQEMCKIMCIERGATLYVPPNDVLVDNAVMIAWLGLQKFSAQGRGDAYNSLKIRPYERTDDVKVGWK